MLTLIKLGGSLITDKQEVAHFREDITRRLAQEIAAARSANPDIQIVVGHGSGSFGHVVASQYGTARGVNTPEQWRGFARVANVAAQLNGLVAAVLEDENVPVWRIQPSASAVAANGMVQQMSLHPIEAALSVGVIPLVYGDVCLDTVLGGTIISTEAVLSHLTLALPVRQILLLGKVPGVLDEKGQLIPKISNINIATYERALKGSDATDVTGGMLSKVRDMLALVNTRPGLEVRILDGRVPGLLRDALLGPVDAGTRIHSN